MTKGHDSKGRFTSGNPGGKGRKADRLRRVLENCITEDDITDIAETLKAMAKAGDLKAAELLLNRLFGKPGQEQTRATTPEVCDDLGLFLYDDDDAPAPPVISPDRIRLDMTHVLDQPGKQAAKA